ncbi:CLP_protease-domain-containing protein [Chaetoceros tenuissimus]|uniref:ATP-dependent Clp protease proteolytic subunit n=1 Tax=Chaetoceros tenuissimus TaxID=426638 RepID=A0AAD3CZ71_9STRA|nr:CLP_protease-domain-containing protein [Chaetoceros tenuissimus]
MLSASCSAFSLSTGPRINAGVRSSDLSLSAVKRDILKMPTETPMVPYKPPGSDYAQFIDIYSRFYRDRIMMIGKYIDENAANEIISIILYLRKEDSTGPITLYFNVPGGDLRPCLAVYDLLMQTRENCEITTVNLGLCAGMGALLCGAGTKGRRCAMPNARFLLQRTGMETPFQGQASDIGLEVANMKKMNDKMEVELMKMTGQTSEKVLADMKRDFYLSSDEAVRYGLIDKVLLPAKKKRATTGQDADIGAFEGEDVQKYQGQEGSGFGSQKDVSNRSRDKKDDDYEPPAVKQ